jgi:signal transduction histidine kinase
MNNARDAFLDRDSGPKEIRITVRREDAEIVIEICDTAGGIPEKILPRIFDPYFSTKSEKNGTGLGLYMTNMIITEHLDSRILVENREEGACFILRLRKGDDNAAG